MSEDQQKQIQDDFRAGYIIAVKTFEMVSDMDRPPNHHVISGLVTAIISGAYSFAPNHDIVDEMISQAQTFAKHKLDNKDRDKHN